MTSKEVKQELMANKVKKKGRILYISYFAPPVGGARSIRLTYFVKYLIRLGWDIDILTIESPSSNPSYDKSLANDMPQNVQVIRTYPGIVHSVLNRKRRHKDTFDFANARTRSSRVRGFAKLLERNLLLPDRAIDWLPFAIKKGRSLIKEKEYQLIFSSAFPFTDHLIGYALKRKAKIPLVLDYGDPWAYRLEAPRSRFAFVIDRRMETSVLKKADAVIVTTRTTKALYQERYKFLGRNKVHVLPNGYERVHFEDTSHSRQKDGLRLVHTGAIYGIRAEIQPFFEGLKTALTRMPEMQDEFSITMAGPVWRREYIDPSLTRFVKPIGFIDFKETISIMRNASILVIWGNRGGLQVPSKVYQYIGANRPILAILADNQDPLREVLIGLNRAIIVENESHEIAAALDKLFESYRKGEMDMEFCLKDVIKFEWPNIVKDLDGVLRTIYRQKG